MNNWRKFVVLPVLLATVLFGTLYAQQVQTVTATVTAQSGGSALVQSWTSGFPSWFPIEGTVGTITTPGGIVYVAVPAGGASPPGTWTIAVYLRNPAELNDAYSFLNMEIQVRAPAALASAWDGTEKHSDLLNPDKGYVVFSVPSTDGLPGKLVVGQLTIAEPADADATLRIFSVGVAEGSFYTKSVTAGDLTPSFSVEVRGR